MSPGTFDIDAEITRLVEARRHLPETLRIYDHNGDGQLDAFELAALRAAVAQEVMFGGGTQTARVLKERYQLMHELGRGAQGQTFLARDVQTSELVAIKVLNLKTAKMWKAIDLFAREVETLRRLSHPGIPAFIDAFDIDETEFFLVQQFIPGDNLLVRLARGELFSQERVQRIAVGLLEVLAHLHTANPPVLHRDIKPSNVILGPEDTVFLVDFGAVQNQGSRGTTIVGTSGYMPPEQLMGRAAPGSDLYAAGATMIHLLTRVHPGDLPVEDLRFKWRDRANIDDGFYRWINTLVSPDIDARPRNGDEALRRLRALLSDAQGALTVHRSTASGNRALTTLRRSPSGNVTVVDASAWQMDFRPSLGLTWFMGVGLLVAGLGTLAAAAAFPGMPWAFGLPLILIGGFQTWSASQKRSLRSLRISQGYAEVLEDGQIRSRWKLSDVAGPVFHRAEKSHTSRICLQHADGREQELSDSLNWNDLNWAQNEIHKRLLEDA